jgi:flagellar biogenesis protein FliO
MQSVQLDNTAMRACRQDGLVGWLLRMWNSRARLRNVSERRMQLLEMLPVGGKRQLALVRCGGEHFLVGLGSEAVSTIVKVGYESEQSR